MVPLLTLIGTIASTTTNPMTAYHLYKTLKASFEHNERIFVKGTETAPMMLIDMLQDDPDVIHDEDVITKPALIRCCVIVVDGTPSYVCSPDYLPTGNETIHYMIEMETVPPTKPVIIP